MENKNNKRKTMYAWNEIRPSLRIKAQRMAHLIGFLAFLVVVLGCIAFDFFSPTSHDLLFLCIDWLLMIATPLGVYGIGYAFGLQIALGDMGVLVIDCHPEDYHLSQQTSHSNGSSNVYRGYSLGSSVSINPSSGRPMSGSSGVDIYGNPYGSRSW
ncbi:TPA: hypothetical protein ACI3W2_002708 [Legionella pneumophila]